MVTLFSVAMFAATDTLYVWDGNGQSAATGLVQKGGTAEAIQASGENVVAGAAQKGNWCLKMNKGFSSGAYYIGIALEQGVNAGDVINIGYFRTSEKSTYVLGMDFSADKASVATTYQILSQGDPQVVSSNGTPVDSTFVVPAGVSNAKYIRIYRNSGSTGTWVSKFVVKREAAAPEPQDKTFYLTLSSDWASWPAKYAMYYFKSAETSQNGWSAFMTAVEGETNMYTGTIPTGYDKMIMVRLDGEATEANWNNKWSQTVNLDVPTNDNNLFTVTSGGTGSECDGVWSKYDPSVPPTPAAPDSIFFVNVPGWDSLRVHLWDGTAAGTTWPGVEMTKLGDDDKINGYDVYKYVAVEGAYTKCIFSNNGKNQTADLTWTSGKYFYDGAWYAKTEIPEPIPAAVPLQGNIWKVVAETPVRAGSHYIDEALLKMDGVYATTVKANARTIAGEEFTHVIQVRTDGYPSADNLAGKEKSGSTSMIITAKEDVDITLYYNRQVLNDTALENDSKDLIVFDQAAIATKVTGTFTIDAYNSEKTYLNATKKLALKKNHVYTVTASGTTLQLHGIKLEEHVPAMQIAGAWDVQEQAWVVNNMTLADNKLTASYEVELTKGDYEFKVLKDGAWLTKSNDGAYGLHREWPGVAGVTDQADNNLKLTADAAGKYTFTWTYANDSIGITFPAPEPPAAKENLYLVPNQWAEGDAKIAAWTWSKDGSINAFTEFFAPKAEGNDTLVAEVLADADSIIFVRFNKDATEPKWNGGEGYQWNQTPGDSIQWEKAVFTIVPSEGYYTNGTWDVYTPEPPAKFYITGNAALVGEALAWNAQAVKATANTYTFVGLHANTEYLLKVIEDGNWDGGKVYGYSNLSVKPEGLSADHDDNIAFKLAADGDVTVTYFWAEVADQEWELTFKVEGNFYVAPKANLYLVPNQWAEGDAKIAAWTWSKDGSINAFTEFFAPKAEGNDTLVAEVLADADSIIFVRFNATATEPKWNGGEDYQWNQTPSDSIQWEKVVFTIVPSEGYYTNGTWDVYTPAQPRLADGFYLIGQKGWAVDSLNADLLFTANPDNAGEYQLTVTLVANQSIKVVSVANDAIVAWYPDGHDNDYTIDEAHAGLKTIYFKPTGDEAWADFGGYFYIEPNQGTGVENGLSDQVQSTKVVRNGQLFIIRDGKTYTVQGVEVK